MCISKLEGGDKVYIEFDAGHGPFTLTGEFVLMEWYPEEQTYEIKIINAVTELCDDKRTQTLYLYEKDINVIVCERLLSNTINALISI